MVYAFSVQRKPSDSSDCTRQPSPRKSMVKSGNMDGSSLEFKHHCAQINLIVSSLNPHVCWVCGSYMKLLVLYI